MPKIENSVEVLVRGYIDTGVRVKKEEFLPYYVIGVTADMKVTSVRRYKYPARDWEEIDHNEAGIRQLEFNYEPVPYL